MGSGMQDRDQKDGMEVRNAGGIRKMREEEWRQWGNHSHVVALALCASPHLGDPISIGASSSAQQHPHGHPLTPPHIALLR